MKPRLSAATIIGAVAVVEALILVIHAFGVTLTDAENAAISGAVAVIGTFILHLFDPTAPDLPPPAPLVREPELPPPLPLPPPKLSPPGK